jgi:uroporphyrinogen decarboxylase
MTTQGAMTSLQRVLTTLGHQEPDRVPFFLLAPMHGARELGLPLREYFSEARYVVEGQLRLRAKYRHDCLYAFFYAAVEIEAWGGEVVWREDGPANSGEPFIRRLEDIRRLTAPRILGTACLAKVLQAIQMLKAQVGNEAPIIGVVMSPFSVPVMQLGFERYLDLMYEHPDLFARLMKVNETFCVGWANAQLAAGATAICYFDPVSSTTIIPRQKYLETGFEVARRTLPRIQGPTATHFASGRCLPILANVAQTGTAMVGITMEEDLAEVKAACRNKLTVLGNLNGLEMRRWTAQQTEAAVKGAIAKAGRGGGFILGDNHGEIPFQVPEATLLALSEAAQQWGRYPLNWIEDGQP